MKVRRAAVGDERVVRDLRIAALTDVPHSFGSTLQREVARTEDDWRRWFSPGVTYLCLDGSDVAVGLVAGVLGEQSGLAELAAMWVHPTWRGQGVGDALVAALTAWAQGEKRRLRLHVVEDSAHAIALYERHCFRPTGTVRVRADRVREVEMERDAR